MQKLHSFTSISFLSLFISFSFYFHSKIYIPCLFNCCWLLPVIQMDFPMIDGLAGLTLDSMESAALRTVRAKVRHDLYIGYAACDDHGQSIKHSPSIAPTANIQEHAVHHVLENNVFQKLNDKSVNPMCPMRCTRCRSIAACSQYAECRGGRIMPGRSPDIFSFLSISTSIQYSST